MPNDDPTESLPPPPSHPKRAEGPTGDVDQAAPYDEEPAVLRMEDMATPEDAPDDRTDDRHDDRTLDELSPGEDLGRGGIGSVEPNEPA